MAVTDTDRPTATPTGSPSGGVPGGRSARRRSARPSGPRRLRLPVLWASGDEESDPLPNGAPERAGARERTGPRRRELSPTGALVRAMLTGLALLALGFVVLLTVGSQFQAARDQQVLFAQFREQLANAVAPVGPVRDGAPLAPGSPVALLEIPEIGLTQVVVYGTTSGDLMLGPGQRRDTVLPGQAGTSIVMGRQAAYGGPFGRIGELARGDEIRVTTGQGVATFTVEGVRRAGDPQPTSLPPSGSRLILTSAQGTPYLPDGVVRVDAALTGTSVDGTDPTPAAFTSAGRGVPSAALPDSERPMEVDTSQVFVLVLWTQLFLVVVVGFTWARERWGRWQAWAVGFPVLLFVGWAVTDQLALLLPNLT